VNTNFNFGEDIAQQKVKLCNEVESLLYV